MQIVPCRVAPAVQVGAAEAAPSSDSGSVASTDKRRIRKKKGKKKVRKTHFRACTARPLRWALPAAVTFSNTIERATFTKAGALVDTRSEPIKGHGPCCPARGLNEPTRWWLCDTGCPYDLTNRSTLPSGTGETHRRKVTLESANGIIECSQAAQLQIEALGENIEPYMLEDSPDVLTVGRRCQKHGWGFY